MVYYKKHVTIPAHPLSLFRTIGAFSLALLFLCISPPHALAQRAAASLFVSPNSGTQTVGSTFTISIFINTSNQSVNAIQADLRFPPDKLQVVSPSAGKSLIGVWVVQPTFDNRNGTIKFQGAIPTPGINTSQGLISEITFRVTSVGTATIRFEDSSRILLNDGKGTDILGQTAGGLFNLILPPPAGPAVSSPTHPDQEKWYPARDAILEWGTDERVGGYSYVVNNQPIDIPDNIADGFKNTQSYKDLNDDLYYFHIKALREGTWGGTTHFAVKVDASPPARFVIDISPSARTRLRSPVINFQTTDALSGVDHYEIKVVGLQTGEPKPGDRNDTLFIESKSPYIPELNYGSYDVIVRAYDRAGNFVQEVKRLVVNSAASDIVGRQGIKISDDFLIPWWVLWSFLGLAGFFAYAYAHHWWHWHRRIAERREKREVSDEIKKKIDELRNLREKYKGFTALLIAMSLGISLVLAPAAHAQTAAGRAADEQVELPPPIVLEVSRNISNEEIFYIGGKVTSPKHEVVIFLQSLETGATFSHAVDPDKEGGWFYTNPRFLGSGNYLLWTQAKFGEAVSPPSPQIPMTVSATALQFGASRLSYETLYFTISLALLGIILAMVAFGIYHSYHGKKKHAHLLEEARKMEDSIQRGFAALHRDIKAELALMEKTKLSKGLSEEERRLEEKIMKDLETVKAYVGREVWELEQEL